MVLRCAALLVIFVSVACAAEYVPYISASATVVGAGLVRNPPAVTYNSAYAGLNTVRSSLRRHDGNGGRIEFGVRRGAVDFYAGYRHSQARRWEGSSDVPFNLLTSANAKEYHVASSAWTDDRIALGGRYLFTLPVDRMPFEIHPMAGGGLTFGWIQQTLDQIDFNAYHARTADHTYREARSSLRPGFFLEMGLLAPVTSGLDIVLSGQYEAIYADFGPFNTEPYPPTWAGEYTKCLNEWTAQLGLRYNFFGNP